MIPSPCIGLCRIDDSSGLCLGCARTRGEIAMWRQASQYELSRVWAELPARRVRLGLGMHRVGWTVNDVRSFIVDTLRFGGGTWVSGIHGAVAEFCVGEGEPIDLDIGEAVANARTSRGAISFRLSEHIRALAFGSSPDPTGVDIVVLAVSRERASPLFGLTCLGPDTEAIGREHRGEALYDFGLGKMAAGFGVRTARPDLVSSLSGCVGLKWPDLRASIGSAILRVSPTRVVRSSLGRIEVFTPIPLPGGPSSAHQGRVHDGEIARHVRFDVEILIGGLDRLSDTAMLEMVAVGAGFPSRARWNGRGRARPSPPPADRSSRSPVCRVTGANPGRRIRSALRGEIEAETAWKLISSMLSSAKRIAS